MSLKEEFMKIITYEEWDKRRYEEWDRRRDEFRWLDAGDMEIRKHLNELYPRLQHSIYDSKGILTEVYPKPKEGEDPKKRRWR